MLCSALQNLLVSVLALRSRSGTLTRAISHPFRNYTSYTPYRTHEQRYQRRQNRRP